MPASLALIESDQTSTSPHVEDLEPFISAVLLQPVRLDRRNPQRAHCKTTRTAVLYARGVWSFCSSLVKLTVEDFRSRLAHDLYDLPLAPTVRASLCEQLRPVRDVWIFWETVEQADLLLQGVEAHPHPHGAVYENIWGGQFFRDRFAGQPRSAAWVQNGLDVLTTIDTIRTYAHGFINKRAGFLHTLWQSGRFMALLAALQEQIPVQWVHDAVVRIEREANEGATPEIRRRARALLKSINVARRAVGKGDIKHRMPEEALTAKRRAASYSKAVKRLIARDERWRNQGLTHIEALESTVRSC